MPIDFFKILGIGLITLVCYLIVKPLKPEVAIFVSLAGGIIILVLCFGGINDIILTITNFANKTGINGSLITLLLKLLGIGYLTEFACNICTEAGNVSLADKISLAGKICILLMGLPIISNLLNLIIGILP